MSEPLRVPMREHASFVSPDDIAASLSARPGPKMGRRFSIDVAEGAFAKMGGDLITYTAKQLAEQAVYRNEAEIRNVIYSYIHDRQWAEPVLREAFKDAAKEWVKDYMQDAQDRLETVREFARICNWAGFGDYEP